MTDREKVIKGLECCKRIGIINCPEDCPYYEYNNCEEQVRLDALELLKEQEAIITAHWHDNTAHWIEGDRNGTDPSMRTTGEMIDTFCCSWCGFYQYWKTPYCPNCGVKMEGR